MDLCVNFLFLCSNFLLLEYHLCCICHILCFSIQKNIYQEIDCLPSKLKALSSNLIVAKKEIKKKKWTSQKLWSVCVFYKFCCCFVLFWDRISLSVPDWRRTSASWVVGLQHLREAVVGGSWSEAGPGQKCKTLSEK
jgi:hypothetical protein